MILNPDSIAAAAKLAGVSTGDLIAMRQHGDTVSYEPAAYLFHESTPRRWLGIIMEGGEVEISRGAQGRNVTLATLTPGSLLSEGVMPDDSPRATSAVTRTGASVWQIPREKLDQFSVKKSDVYYRIVGRIASRISERREPEFGRLAAMRGSSEFSSVAARIEQDFRPQDGLLKRRLLRRR